MYKLSGKKVSSVRYSAPYSTRRVRILNSSECPAQRTVSIHGYVSVLPRKNIRRPKWCATNSHALRAASGMNRQIL